MGGLSLVMWILLMIVFNIAPMRVENLKVLEVHQTEKECLSRLQDAKVVGIPVNTNIGCLKIKGVSQT